MKSFSHHLKPKNTQLVFRETSADTAPVEASQAPVVSPENLGPRIESETSRLGATGLTLTPDQIPLIAQNESHAITMMTEALDDQFNDILSNPRLQGAATLSGIDAENLGDSVRSLGLEDLEGAADTLAAASSNFASQVRNGEIAGNEANLFTILQNILEEVGITIDPDNEAARTSVSNLGAGAGAYNIEPSRGPGENPPGTVEWERANQELIQGGILSLRSSGMGGNEDGRSRASNRTCIDGLRESTITGAKAIQSELGGTKLVCTGGTEEGHANGEMSHYNGYKLDYAVSDELVQLTGLTSMGSRRTMTIGGQRMDFYRHAPDHFDVKFYPA